MKLSKHFTLAELTRSATAQRLGLDNSPTVHELANLMRLAAVLEDVRHVLGSRPILISSGFRSEAVNKAVSGSTSSAHRLGLAADFTCPDFGSPLMVCKAIASSGIQFDQLISPPAWMMEPSEPNFTQRLLDALSGSEEKLTSVPRS